MEIPEFLVDPPKKKRSEAKRIRDAVRAKKKGERIAKGERKTRIFGVKTDLITDPWEPGYRVAVWKAFERSVAEMFMGHRVPLSGMNSRHGTSADVFFDKGHPLGDWLYIEVKRDRQYNRLFESYHEKLRAGEIGVQERPDPLFYFWLVSFSAQHLQTPLPVLISQQGFRTDPDYCKISNLYDVTKEKADKEKKIVLLTFRVHSKKGIYCVCNYECLKRLKPWLLDKVTPKRSYDSKEHQEYVAKKRLLKSLQMQSGTYKSKASPSWILRHLNRVSVYLQVLSGSTIPLEEAYP